MKVEFNIPEMAVANIIQRHGTLDISKFVTVEITLPNGSLYSHNGTIYFIDNQVTASTGTIRQRARFPNPDAVLTPNEYVKVRLVVTQKRSTILIPKIAIMEDMTGSVALVVKDGKVERRQLKTGHGFDRNMEVISGISDGDWVITEGMLKVRPGMTVNAKLDTSSTRE